MFKQNFGLKNQVVFENENEYYEFLGFLSKNDGSTSIVHEDNDEQGAWGKEKRILFYIEQPTDLSVRLLHTAGVANILSRVNCNEFVENLIMNHNFISDGSQNVEEILSTIPEEFKDDFSRGLTI